MSLPQVVSREEWLAARKELLAKEKAATRARDALNAERRRLPMVRVDKEYVFEGPRGKASLLDLFEGRRQLVVHHFMFDPSWDVACRSCSGTADTIPEHLVHLHARATTLAAVSRAPLAKITAFRARMGWTFPWYSSHDSDFNYDFHVTLDESVTPVVYNYRTPEEHTAADTAYYMSDDQPFELPGLSTFLRDGDTIYHTYSTYGRGIETAAPGIYSYLDLTALGRQEEWEEPKGRASGGAAAGTPGVRFHDEY
jgi:predicted dithiol-disulfide oxidoreductase (DUF899 family)